LSSYLERLIDTHPLREKVLKRIIREINLPRGSRGLDAGCGLGIQTLWLAEEIGLEGHVTGFDLSTEFIAYARHLLAESALAGRVSFEQGDLTSISYADDTFDWAWSADCAGYGPANPLSMIRELTRVVKPKGSVVVLAWSSQQLLPGHPMLEARLNATSMGIAPFRTGMRPESHFLRGLGWMKEAGLIDIAAHTFAGDVDTPLSDTIRKALLSLIQMRWEGAEAKISKRDWSAFQRLCDPGSPEYILDLPDYYAFFTYSLFRGVVPG
jgi:demethylmenaquinone methyltransferase/2-methoxy-6-polyprenyl-1,4-benzoquinol methylase